jgi:hypothetical protein
MKDEALAQKADPPKYLLFGQNCGDWVGNLHSKCWGKNRGCTPLD